MFELFDLPCHEIENLLPPGLVLDSFMPNEHEPHKRCMSVGALGFLGAADPLYHLDLKEGLCLRDVHRAVEKPAKQAFLRGVFDTYREHAASPDGGFCEGQPPCMVEGRKREDDKKHPCRCVLFAGLGSSLIERVAARCLELSPQKLAEHFFSPDLPCRSVWLSLCRQIFSFGCAHARTRL